MWPKHHIGKIRVGWLHGSAGKCTYRSLTAWVHFPKPKEKPDVVTCTCHCHLRGDEIRGRDRWLARALWPPRMVYLLTFQANERHWLKQKVVWRPTFQAVFALYIWDIHACMYTRSHTYTCVHTQICTHTLAYSHTHTGMCTHIHTHTHCIHMHVNMHTYIHTKRKGRNESLQTISKCITFQYTQFWWC